MNRKLWILGWPNSAASAMRLFALMMGGLLLGACGQKGPLYHPTGDAGSAPPVITPYSIESDPLQEEIILPR